MAKKTAKRNRSAKTGQFVSARYARKHKATTVSETIKKPRKK